VRFIGKALTGCKSQLGLQCRKEPASSGTQGHTTKAGCPSLLDKIWKHAHKGQTCDSDVTSGTEGLND